MSLTGASENLRHGAKRRHLLLDGFGGAVARYAERNEA